MSDTTATFTDFGVAEDLAAELRSRGIVHPFPIQELTLPLGLKGHDIIGQARTGTGKTLGFGLPLLQRIDTDRAQTQALVIVPTRELRIQVADDLTVGAGRGVTSIAVYGGVGYDEQIEALTAASTSSWARPAALWTCSGAATSTSPRSAGWSSTRPTRCSTWASCPTSNACWPPCRRTATRCCSRPPCRPRSSSSPAATRTTRSSWAPTVALETAPTVDQYFFLVFRMDKPRLLARILRPDDRGSALVFSGPRGWATG